MEFNLYIRATKHTEISQVHILFFYVTSGYQRIFFKTFELKTKSSFKIKGNIEWIDINWFLVAASIIP